jgi:hypothetical protein
MSEWIGGRPSERSFDPAKLRLNKFDKHGYPNEDGSI